MMAAMGRPDKAADAARLRKRHKLFGWAYVVLLAPLVFLGVGFVKDMGDGMSTRGALHVVLAVTLVAVLLLKVLVVRAFRGFLKSAPALGLTLFALTLVVFLVTAGFVLAGVLS
jgi:hypothetical protein